MPDTNTPQNEQTPPPDERLCRKCRQNQRSGKHRWCTVCIAASRKRPRKYGQAAPGTREPSGRFLPLHGHTFKRGPDQIPRGSVKLMFAVAALDTREARYENLCRIHKGEAGALAFLKLQELTADRLEGKPTQHIVADHRRTTSFVLDGQATPVTEGEAQAAVPPESTDAPRADLTMLPPGLPVDGAGAMEPPA